jgi:hypothetical protein
MLRPRTCILSAAVFLTLAAGAAWAQNNPAQSTSQPAATASATMADVSKWTRKQWTAAKAKWSAENVKWGDCRKQATAKKLSGRASWQFLYDCMTK